MKIIIVGAGTIGLGLAAQIAERAAKLGIEAETREATPQELKHCYQVKPSEPEIIVEALAGFRQILPEELDRRRRKAYNYLF